MGWALGSHSEEVPWEPFMENRKKFSGSRFPPGTVSQLHYGPGWLGPYPSQHPYLHLSSLCSLALAEDLPALLSLVNISALLEIDDVSSMGNWM